MAKAESLDDDVVVLQQLPHGIVIMDTIQAIEDMDAGVFSNKVLALLRMAPPKTTYVPRCSHNFRGNFFRRCAQRRIQIQDWLWPS